MPRPSVEAERRAQILRAACAVIADKGFARLRVSDVAAAAGVSGGTVHYYFDTKQDLVHAAFEDNYVRSLQRRRWILDTSDDPVQKLRLVVDSYLPDGEETTEAWKVWAELWSQGMHQPELRELHDRMYGDWRRIVAGVIRDGQRGGQLRPGNAVHLANMLISMIDGLAYQVLLGSTAMPVSRMRATCLAFLDDLKVPSG
ncbi:TetR/AcrR family transcriptional regulator [Amycolatopsis sp. YIM 10]|uniref:TetR/AcrR family transcriptional regulator n=1 Tax=Amycolatopsis sp. YIM 10 TaxID=2653857 RepID=UPI00128FEE92|nr:TetR/AcrR family transcriptional regulator [Amycolatopsis sp. YIM 10]QFU85511.1 Fatty acid metabolism regulator protein [Amycolatopsis sp. YIM 10]